MTTTAAPEAPQAREPEGDDLRDALIREARQRARRRRLLYVGAAVVIGTAAIAAWSTASSDSPPPPATLDDRLPPAKAGPGTVVPGHRRPPLRPTRRLASREAARFGPTPDTD